MTVLQALFLGMLQGVTEFLPISSSGHLVLAERILGLTPDATHMQTINILLHAGTLFALLFAYASTWKKLIVRPLQKQTLLLVVATIPAGIVGLVFEEWIAKNMQHVLWVGIGFALTACILLIGEYVPRKHGKLWNYLSGMQALSPRTATLIGVAQACALLPGLSRSGLTISVGRLLGLQRKDAIDFSFLMSAPIITAAVVLSVPDVLAGNHALPATDILITAVASSFVVSLLAILFLRRYVVTKSFAIFAPYLFALSLLTLYSVFT